MLLFLFKKTIYLVKKYFLSADGLNSVIRYTLVKVTMYGDKGMC